MNYIIPIFLIIIFFGICFQNPIFITEFFDEKYDVSELYVITLGKEERMLNIKNQQTKINKKINIFDGVNGLKLNIDDLVKKIYCLIITTYLKMKIMQSVKLVVI